MNLCRLQRREKEAERQLRRALACSEFEDAVRRTNNVELTDADFSFIFATLRTLPANVEDIICMMLSFAGNC